jgi:AcrR family transcriptional regulator
VERGLLAAGEAVLVRNGSGGLMVRAVATEAGIAPMGVYSHLGGKEGLVDTLLICGFDRLRETLEQAREDVGDPSVPARLVACGLRYRQFALSNPHFYEIMFEGPGSSTTRSSASTPAPPSARRSSWRSWRRPPG